MEKKPSLLVVEDDPADLRLVKELLAEAAAEFQLTTAASLGEAKELAASNQFDAILADLHLPDARGVETIEGLCEVSPGSAIVGLTGQTEAAGKAAIQAGAQDFLEKDALTGALLKRIIDHGIQRKRRDDALQAQTERALGESRASYEILAATARDGIITVDDQGEIEYANPAAEKLLGWEAGTMQGNSARRLLARKFRDRFATSVTKTIERYPAMMEENFMVQAMRKDSTEFPVEVSVNAWELNGLQRFTVNIHDISSRVGLLQELEHERRRFAGLVENSQDSITVIGPNGTRIYTSPGIKVITGFTPEELEGVNALERVHPDDKARVSEALAQVLQDSGGITESRYRVKHKDGHWVQVQSTAVNLLDDPGVRGIVVTARDVTTEAEAQDKLHTAEEEQRSMLESLPIGVYRTSIDGEVIRANSAAAKLFGYASVEDLKEDRSEVQYADPEGRKKYLAELEAAEGTLIREVPFKHKSGRLIWARVQSALVRDERGTPMFIDGTLEDITERHAAEQEVRESERRFRSVYDSAPLGLAMVGANGKAIQANPALQKMLGMSEQEILNASFFDLLDDDERPQAQTLCQKLSQGKAETAEFEAVLVGKADKKVRATFTVNAHKDDAGNFLHSLCLVNDVTEQREAEAALAHSEATYRRLVQHANDVILTCDQVGTIQSINPAVERVFGYGPDEVRGQNVLDFIEEHRRNDVFNDLADIASRSFEAPDAAYSVQAIHKDGHKLWIEIMARAAVDEEGEFSLHATIRDITERRRAAQALKRSERQFRTMFEAAPVGILNVDSDGNIFQANPAGRDMLGQAEADLLGTNLATLALDDDARMELQNRFEALVKGNATHIAMNVQFKVDGRSIWGDLEAVAIRNDEDAFLHATVLLQDETERKIAEARLAESEAKHRGMVDQLPIGVYRTTEDGTILHVNPAMASIFGFDSPDEMQAAQAGQFFASEEDRVRQVERRRGSDGVYIDELMMRRQDGTEVWVRDVGRIVTAADGERYIDGTVEDITDRKHAQQRLVQSEERFRRLYDLAPMAIFTVGPDRRILQANPTTQEITGYTEGELRKLSFGDITYPEDAEESAALFEELFRGDVDRIRLEKRYVRKDGSIMWGEVVVVAVRDSDGNFLNTISIMEDVTERREAQENVRISEQRHRELFEGVPVGLYRNTEAGIIVNANPAMATIFGFDSVDEFIGTNITDFYLDAADRQEVLSRVQEGGEFQVQFRRKDGAHITVRGSENILIQDDGSVLYDGNLRDVTEEMAAEDERRVAGERLARIQQLEDLQALRSTFLNVASHELNTPITPIVNELFMFSSGMLGELNEDQSASVKVLQRNVDRLALLVKDILDVSRIDGGTGLRLSIEDDKDFNKILQETLESFGTTIEEKKLTIEKEIEEPLVAAMDERRVSQVLYNLMSNACKYTPEGGNIHVDARRQGEEVVFTVMDSGIGLPADRINQLFEPFTQLHDTTKVTVQSTGLGLYICKGIIEEHGGRIWADSEGVGEGSTFSFSLPVVAVKREEKEDEENLTA